MARTATRRLDRFKLKELLAARRLATYGDAAELMGCSRSRVDQLASGVIVSDLKAKELAGKLGAAVDALFPLVSQ